MVLLNGRQKALLERGYTYDEVIGISSFSNLELNERVKIALDRITDGLIMVNNPEAIFIGGQPGSGKSSVCMNIKNTFGNIAFVNIDDYRVYHPRYFDIESCIREHWIGRIETEEDNPGNDLADFTHQFVSDISDAIIEEVTTVDDIGYGYNVLIEWGMRNPVIPLQTMCSLKMKGYTIRVGFVCVHKDISMEACMVRANISDGNIHIVRKPSISFHELCIKTLPKSINSIYRDGYLSGIVSSMNLCLRDGTVLWDASDVDRMPGEVFLEYLENYELTKQFGNSSEMARLANVIEIDGISLFDKDSEHSVFVRKKSLN